MLKWPGHLAIAASAGTGKTYRLAHRFVQLVMYGEPPERIVALTFSRKAAGEIFDRVVALFIAASSSPEEASAMNDRIGFPDGSPKLYRDALRKLLEALPRSRVGTIDSFTVGIVRSFPYELGLDPDFSVFDMGGLDARYHQGQALRHILLHAGSTEDERKAFLKTFNDATFGHEEKQASGILRQLIEDYQQLYRLQPEAGRWSLEPDVAASGLNKDTIGAAIDAFADAVTGLSLQTTPHTYFMEFCDELRIWSPELTIPNRMKYILEKMEEHFAGLGTSAISIKLNRDTFTLDETVGAQLRALITYIVENVIHLANYRTAGLYRVVERYEAAYDELVRRRGFLTFDDALYSLTGHRLVSNAGDDADDRTRLAINYRLDGRLDHWLLDEFQDTSAMQWQVMSSLVDEVLQDSEQRRTFFYVGDVKQAIYGWRGGNAELFRQIHEHYNAGGEGIRLEHSNVSYRSVPPIIDTVNRVFSALPDDFNPEAVARWNADWHDHACSDAKQAQEGYVEWLELERGEVDGEDETTRKLKAAADTVARINPLKRGLSAAILTRDNKSAQAAAGIMRSLYPEIPVALEGKSHIADNPAVCLLISLLQWASHPGDLFALRHLQMSELAKKVAFKEHDTIITGQVMEDVQYRGFQRTLTQWAETLRGIQPLSPYEEMRMQQLLDLAARADRDTSRDVDHFVDQVRDTAIEDAASRQSVRIMTIHKSKGLGFDVVVLPDLQGRGRSDSGAMVQWNEERSQPEWILQHINKPFARYDEHIQSCMDAADTRGKYEELCILYVAMTRAARALYIITTELSAKSTAKSYAMILRETLGEGSGDRVLYGEGNSSWYEEVALGDDQEAMLPKPRKLLFQLKRDERYLPSAGGEFERSAAQVFGTGLRESREFGTAVHAVFEGIEWLSASDDLTDPKNQAAVVHVQECLKAEEARALFKQPKESCDVWREQPFEVMLDGEWVSGVFDRVVLCKDRADIIDFKTNRINGDEHLAETAGHYKDQLETYRNALSLLTGREPASIRTLLVFTDAARVVEI